MKKSVNETNAAAQYEINRKEPASGLQGSGDSGFWV